MSSFVLGAHPEVATVGEPGIAPGIDLEHFQCSCGALISECTFWKRVSERMRSLGLDFDISHADLRFRVRDDVVADLLLRIGPKGPFLEAGRSAAIRLWPRAARERARLLERYEAFISVVTEIRERNTFVDIAKRPGRLIHLRRSAKLDLNVIRLTRDPRAVAHSCMKNLGMTLDEGARSWLRFQRESRRVMELLPQERCLTIQYEELCREPQATLELICRSTGLTPLKHLPDFRAEEHHIIGNRMRLQSGSEIRLDEKWREALSSAQVARVNQIVGTDYDRVPKPASL